MTPDQSIAALEAAIPRLVRDAMTRTGLTLQAAVDRNIRWHDVTGRARRSFTIGDSNNVQRFSQQGPARFSMEYGTSLDYVRNLPPALTPAFEEFDVKDMQGFLLLLLQMLASTFNG